MVTFALAYFNMNDLAEIGRMTLKDFRLRKQAYLMRSLEREREMHLQAFLNRNIKATNKKGDKYAIEKFEDFYDAEKRMNEILGKTNNKPVSQDLIERAKRIQKMRKEGING